MYALTLIVAALGLAAAAPSNGFEVRQLPTVASVDRYAGGGCTGTICASLSNPISTIHLDYVQT